NTVAEGTRFPMSTMPGEQVDHVFAGQMGPETIHFLEACIMDRPVMVTPESARMVMETYTAADLSAERNEPVDLPLSNPALSAVAEMVGGKRRDESQKASGSPSSAPAGSDCFAAKSQRAIPPCNGSASPRRTITAACMSRKRSAPTSSPRIFASCSSARSCAIIATDEHLHVDPIMAAVERGVPMLIEKPLATDLGESARVLEAITIARLDAVVGYTQRFRRKWLAAKEKVRTGALGDVTLVTSRAFMNRLVAIDNYKRTNDPKAISPMVISGTHALDIVMWCMEAKTPVECYARSIDKVLGPA